MRLEQLEGRKLLAALDPNAFISLGNLNATGGSYNVDTDALTLTGPNRTSFTGVLSGGVAGFDFSSVTVDSTGVIDASGSHPLAILSRGSIIVDGTIDASGQDSLGSTVAVPGGPGGYGGVSGPPRNNCPGKGPVAAVRRLGAHSAPIMAAADSAGPGARAAAEAASAGALTVTC